MQRRGERETESKRANEMVAEDTETERNEGEIEKEGGRDANPDRLMIVPPAATGRMEGRDGTQHNFGIFRHVLVALPSPQVALPSLLARTCKLRL